MSRSIGSRTIKPFRIVALRGDGIGFGLVARAFHWLTVLMLFGSFAVVWSVRWLPAGPDRAQAVGLHRTIGLLVLWLTVLRLMWRLSDRLPPGVKARPWRIAAGGVHAALYAGLLAGPLLGWTYTNARGHTLLLFGIKLPSLIFKDEYFSRVAINFHEWVAYSLLALIGAHTGAALWHHVLLGDAILKRMWRG